MTKICLFAGTTEGRKLAEFLAGQDAELTVCVATDYGGKLIRPAGNLKLISGRLSAEEIQEMTDRERFDLVIDATHPYAVRITENIAEVCQLSGTPCRRLLRGDSDIREEAAVVPDIPSAVGLLSKTSGNILLTTGSKEIAEFSGIDRFCERVYARVLPMPASLEACTGAGLEPPHILAMQGPFSEEMNIAFIHAVSAEWIVTKDGGGPGGFEAKASAAAKTGARLLVIGRPPQHEGLDEKEMYAFLRSEFGFTRKPSVKIIGIGPGNKDMMTAEAIRAIENAECLIGAGRMLEAAARPGVCTYEAISEKEISGFIRSHPEIRSFAVLMSGDSGFFSGTKRLLPLLADCDTEILPGISSLVFLCAKIGRSYEDVRTVSLHGRGHDLLTEVRSHTAVFVLTGGTNSVSTICRDLITGGFGHLRLTVGERLSYPDEKITSGRVSELSEGPYAPLSVMLIENEAPDRIVTHGLPDEAFSRDTGEKGLIPMTKSEIRSVCLSKLQLTERSVCWDIGAGTGSAAIEMALQAREGQVYAVERDPAAAELIRKNADRLSAGNITVITGTAPEACEDLPSPDRVFIGGSSGNLAEILRMLAGRKKAMRIVVTAVTLKTVAELAAVTADLPAEDTETVLIQTAKGKKAGNTELMLGGNPVWVFSMRFPGEA